MKLKERAKELKQNIPFIFAAIHHPHTPWYAKALAGITIGYALSPIDLIPDFIPILGYLDDIIILPALIALVIHLIPKEVFQECRNEKKKLQKKWYYAIPIVLIWILILFFCVLKFMR
ncbi:MAG: YkvA family protein [Lachnospiraceae bacterium]